MALLATAINLHSCPRCTGPMYQDYEEEATCLYCGEHVYANVPPRPELQAAPVSEGPRKRGRPRKHFVAA